MHETYAKSRYFHKNVKFFLFWRQYPSQTSIQYGGNIPPHIPFLLAFARTSTKHKSDKSYSV